MQNQTEQQKNYLVRKIENIFKNPRKVVSIGQPQKSDAYYRFFKRECKKSGLHFYNFHYTSLHPD